MSESRNIPIVCDMTDAPDTPAERRAEYQQLFDEHLVARDRTASGIRFRFRRSPGVETHVRDLAAKEHACCAFLSFTITGHDDEIWWDSSTVDDPIARQILDQLYELPDTVTDGAEALYRRFGEQGLQIIIIHDDGVRRPASTEELGLA